MNRKWTIETVKRLFLERGCDLLEKEYFNPKISMSYKCKCGNISKTTLSNFQHNKCCINCSGTKKYTLEYVKQFFEDNGCLLLENEYKNNHTKMSYVCSCGNISKINFNSFSSGIRCWKCKGERTSKKLNLSFEYVKNYFSMHGCELLEENYKNNLTLMKYRCICGDINKISFGHFQNGQRCRKCSGRKKYEFDYVKKFFDDHRCKLLEKEYKTHKGLLRYKCKCGNESKISFVQFRMGHRCMKCSGNEKFTFEYVKKSFSEKKCELLETEYKNSQQPMRYRCNFGHIEKTAFNSFMSGRKCKQCEKERIDMFYRENPKNRKMCSEYREWRKNVLERDNYKCLVCKNGMNLHAHHLKNYRDYPELVIQIDNGATVCKKCHIKFHGKYGRMKNNEMQFQEYIRDFGQISK